MLHIRIRPPRLEIQQLDGRIAHTNVKSALVQRQTIDLGLASIVA